MCHPVVASSWASKPQEKEVRMEMLLNCQPELAGYLGCCVCKTTGKI
jgi:hypothetical protein